MSFAFICAAAFAIDGDTLRCANIAEAGGRVRLARIDAAELHEPGGPEAREALQAMLTGPVFCRQVDVTQDRPQGVPRNDRYGRIVARCRVGERGHDLSERMVRAGQAQRWGS
ncbi:thermonuclease family protein [Alteraurantiacibacter palmitatis]|uniref:Thermonuclease family protein n=1 Tax=Alteraurantiacibacter palmitatis TaxID=2054628 RepID=A0ABV7E3Q4_9SPHN